MTPQRKDVLLIGLGGIGAVYALALKRSGRVYLSVVARSNFDAVQKNGLTFRSDKHGDHIKGWKPDRLLRSVSDAADRGYDYIFVATKVVPEILTTEKMLAPILTQSYTEKFGQPVYILLQNGIGVEKGLATEIADVEREVSKGSGRGQVFDEKRPRIVSTCVYCMGNLIQPDMVEYVEGHRLTVGVYRPDDLMTTQNSPEEAVVLNDLKSLLEAGGAGVDIVPEIQRQKMRKNMLNLAFATFATLSNHTVPCIFRPPPPDPSKDFYEPYVHHATAHLIEEFTIPNIRAVLTEAVSVGHALGLSDTEDGLPSSTVPRFLEYVRNNHLDPKNNHAPSMLLDMRQGKPMEVEVILGEVVRLAKRVGVDIPRIEMMYAILLVVQNQILRNLAIGRS
uniref:2-dehydropantoate 2-reductase n=1 Tax=Moniliophthora roreri TaxID=221103 RepID=A0A0W0FFA8_MONRR